MDRLVNDTQHYFVDVSLEFVHNFKLLAYMEHNIDTALVEFLGWLAALYSTICSENLPIGTSFSPHSHKSYCPPLLMIIYL
jgi:hypothetical protein